MFLRNYYNLWASSLMGIKSTDTTTFGDGHINYKIWSGGINGFYYYSPPYIPCPGDIEGNKVKIYFGTGTTPVTFDDYWLEAQASNVSVANFVKSAPAYDSSTKKWSSTISMVVSNGNSSSITLSEMLIESAQAYGSGSYTNYIPIYREVLATPITLAAGESVSYTHTFEFTMPTIS